MIYDCLRALVQEHRAVCDQKNLHHLFKNSGKKSALMMHRKRILIAQNMVRRSLRMSYTWFKDMISSHSNLKESFPNVISVMDGHMEGKFM